MDDAKWSKVLHKCADEHAALDKAVGGESECHITRELRETARALGARADRGEGKGPAQVATETYRANYETIFGKTAVGEA